MTDGAPTFNTRHTLTGKLQRLTADQISVFPEYLQVVADDAKPFEPGMFKPGKVGEFDNPEPPTDEQVEAQAQLDAVLEERSARTNEAREAKARLDEANENAAPPELPDVTPTENEGN